MKEDESGECEQVEDAVKDHLPVRGDHVPTVRKAPSDWIEEKKEGEVGGGPGEQRADVGTDQAGAGACGAKEDDDHPDERDDAEDEVAPFVGRGHKGTDEGGDSGDDSEEGDAEDVSGGDAGGEEEGGEDRREGDHPLDVAHILFLTVRIRTSTAALQDSPKSHVKQVHLHSLDDAGR